jgi:hypothetical protein
MVRFLALILFEIFRIALLARETVSGIKVLVAARVKSVPKSSNLLPRNDAYACR